MATYLFHSSLSLSHADTGVQYDEALRLRNEGHRIYFLYCNGLMSQCFENIEGDLSLCYICKSKFKEEKKSFGKQIEFISEAELLDKSKIDYVKNYKYEYSNIEEIKELEYKNINIGLGALSGYISRSRNLSPLIDDKFKLFFDQNLINATLTVEAVLVAIFKFNPDHIVLYNGRLADSRPVWQIALKQNIPFTTLEYVKGVSKNFKDVYVNSIPHSIDKKTELINTYWENSKLDYETKCEIGSSFFERRRSSLYTGDKLYTKDQVENLLPNNWDSTKKNIVIFNSSEDEFAAVGDEFDKYKIFSSQLDGLNFLKNNLRDNPEINITLRIHPNLSDVQYSYAKELLKLQSDNFYVIDGKSKISSYSLLDNADIVVVFGSTVGVESVFWNKPAVLLAGSNYYKLDCCYIPQNANEVIRLLLSDLQPKIKFKQLNMDIIL